MSNRWLAVAIVLVACGPSRDEPSNVFDGKRLHDDFLADARRRQQTVMEEAQQRLKDLSVSPDMRPQPPPDPQQQRPLPAASTCLDSGTVVSFEAGSVLRACFDRDADGVPDRCARWRPDGRPIPYDPGIDEAHSAEAPEETAEPIVFHSDTTNNDEARIELTGTAVEVCPYERACLKLMPRIPDNHTLAEAFTDAEYRRAALVISDSAGGHAHAELWDLDRGRVYAKLPFRGLMREIEYTFSLRFGRGALVALASAAADGTVAGAVYGLDGGFRGMLAGGARSLELDGAIETAGQFVILEEQPDKRPYVLHAVDLATGAQGRFPIARADESATWIMLHKLRSGLVSTVQWGKRLRLDVIDLRTRAQRTLFAKGC